MINPVSIGNKITKEREKLGLSQIDLSSLVYVTPQAISKWENGLSIPSIEVLARLTKIFSLSIDELIVDSNDDLTELFQEHSREYVLDMIVSSRIEVDLSKNLHLFTMAERLRVLSSLLSKHNSHVLRECWHLLSIQERMYVYQRMNESERGSLYLSNKERIILKKENRYEL